MLGQQLLNIAVIEELSLGQTEYLHGLDARHKSAPYSQSFLRNLLAALVDMSSLAVLFHKLFEPECSDFSHATIFGQRPDIALVGVR